MPCLGCSGRERKIAEPKGKDAKRILKYKMDGSGAKKDTKKYPKNMKKSKKIEPFASFNISSFKVLYRFLFYTLTCL